MKGGMIIRLIDVVLIILFGFIGISDIQVKRQIKLPGGEKKQQQAKERKDVMFWININKQGTYSLEVEERPVLRSARLPQLKKTLLKEIQPFKKKGKQIVVVINPDPGAKMQAMIDAYDLCEAAGIPKSINIENALPK